nr:BREX system ATP-binding domain-containing protein [Frankia canadensis]
MLAVGLETFTPAPDRELDTAAGGGSVFKAVRGEYGQACRRRRRTARTQPGHGLDACPDVRPPPPRYQSSAGR